MLDENLPAFHFKQSNDNPLSSTIYFTQSGQELKPEYALRKPDPNLPESRDRYAVAICDCYNTDVLFAEVLVEPEWSQPSLSAAESRTNGKSAPPVPIVPQSFAIQLYNPDQQVTIRQIPGTWNSAASWEFELPQQTFRMPSTSQIDRSQNDPTASDVTPKVSFKWKRDGKLNKDISCYLSGKNTDGKRSKEPDIVIAMFKQGQNLILYEPNMHRIEVEDSKGLEVVLLLSSIVIKDIFFNPSRDMFNIASPSSRKNSGPTSGRGRATSLNIGLGMTSATAAATTTSSNTTAPPRLTLSPTTSHSHNHDNSNSNNSSNSHPSAPYPPSSQIPNAPAAAASQHSSPPPAPSSSSTPNNARAQWEIDAETARLQALVQAEERERAKRERAEQKRLKKMLEQEDKERRRRDAEVERETERLRRQYGVAGQTIPPLPPRSSGLPGGGGGGGGGGLPHGAYPPPPPLPGHPNGGGGGGGAYSPAMATASTTAGLDPYYSAPHARPTPFQRPVSTPATAAPVPPNPYGYGYGYGYGGGSSSGGGGHHAAAAAQPPTRPTNFAYGGATPAYLQVDGPPPQGQQGSARPGGSGGPSLSGFFGNVAAGIGDKEKRRLAKKRSSMW